VALAYYLNFWMMFLCFFDLGRGRGEDLHFKKCLGVMGVRVNVSRFLYLLDIDDVYCVKLVLDPSYLIGYFLCLALPMLVQITSACVRGHAQSTTASSFTALDNVF
jgi:hypothetical protein